MTTATTLCIEKERGGRDAEVVGPATTQCCQGGLGLLMMMHAISSSSHICRNILLYLWVVALAVCGGSPNLLLYVRCALHITERELVGKESP